MGYWEVKEDLWQFMQSLASRALVILLSGHADSEEVIVSGQSGDTL